MHDLLILGRDREPSPWPRRLAAVAVLIVLAVVVITHLPAKRETQPRHPAATASAGPVQLAGLGSGAAGLLDQADGVTRPARPATSPSAPGSRPGPPHHSTGRLNVRRCPHHPVMRAGDGASPDATGSYCGPGTLQ
jgi:hypothetical protein